MQFVVLNITPDRASEIDMRSKRVFNQPREDRVNHYWVDRGLAEREASQLAQKNPGQQFAVMIVSRVFETTTPKVITKVYTDEGELIREKEDK